MNDRPRSREELNTEVALLRRRIAELEALLDEQVQVGTALRNSQEQLSLILDGVPALIAYVDSEQRYVRVNRAYAEWYGWTKEEMIGKHVSDVLTGNAYEVASVYYNKVLAGQEVSFENVVRDRNGRTRVVGVGLVPHFDDGGKVRAFFGLVQDITESKEAEEALRERSTELQTRNEELDAFAHTVAHDLQNPLSLIIGFAELLEKDHADLAAEDVEHYLHTIVLSGRKMANIVNELLLLAGVRKLDVEMSSLNMQSIVLEAQVHLADMIEEQRVEIVAPAAWPAALGYAPWVEEVWVNYLSNAIRYGGCPPRVEVGAVVQADGMVRFYVRDNGRGLTPDDQDRLFVPFTKLAQARVKGHGLGLSIVRRIIEKLNGQVGVESEVGKGSVFFFTLPGVSRER